MSPWRELGSTTVKTTWKSDSISSMEMDWLFQFGP